MFDESLPQPASASRSPRVWAIGGGKGGVGKSVIATNLGVALARAGKRCVLLDADLGGANVHTLLGIPSPKASITDLLLRQADALSELLTPTPIPNLQLISGARPLFEMANPHHQQKIKIIRQIVDLDADYVLLDLGAGSSFNTLDFFLAAHEQFIVVAPLPTAMENAYHFLKAAFYRQMGKAARQAGVTSAVERAMRDRAVLGIRSPRNLLAYLAELDPKGESFVRRRLEDFQPRIIVNQLRREEDFHLGTQMARAGSEYFGTPFHFMGALRSDDRVYRAVQMRRPVLEAFPDTGFSVMVRDFIRRLLETEEEQDEQRESAAGV